MLRRSLDIKSIAFLQFFVNFSKKSIKIEKSDVDFGFVGVRRALAPIFGYQISSYLKNTVQIDAKYSRNPSQSSPNCTKVESDGFW